MSLTWPRLRPPSRDHFRADPHLVSLGWLCPPTYIHCVRSPVTGMSLQGCQVLLNFSILLLKLQFCYWNFYEILAKILKFVLISQLFPHKNTDICVKLCKNTEIITICYWSEFPEVCSPVLMHLCGGFCGFILTDVFFFFFGGGGGGGSIIFILFYFSCRSGLFGSAPVPASTGPLSDLRYRRRNGGRQRNQPTVPATSYGWLSGRLTWHSSRHGFISATISK